MLIINRIKTCISYPDCSAHLTHTTAQCNRGTSWALIQSQRHPAAVKNKKDNMSNNQGYYCSWIPVNCAHMAPTGIIEEKDLLVHSSCDLHKKNTIGLQGVM